MNTWSAINGPYGSLITALAGIAWLTAVAFWPTRKPVLIRVIRDHDEPSKREAMSDEPVTILAPTGQPLLPQTDHERVFVDVSPRYLLDCFKGETSAQAKSRVSPFIDKWMRISGHIADFDDTGARSAVFLSEYKYLSQNGQVVMWFDKKWNNRLEVIPYGGNNIVD